MGFAIDMLRMRGPVAASTITLLGNGKQSKAAAGGTTSFLSSSVFSAAAVAAVLPGDYVVIGVATGSVTSTQAASWTMSGTIAGSIPRLTNLYSNDTRDTNMAVFAFFVPAGGLDSTFDMSGVVTDILEIVGAIYRGVHATTPQDAALTTATGINTDRPAPPSITTVTANAKVVAFYGGAQGAATAYTAPGNMTNWNGGRSLPSIAYIADADKTTPGAFTPAAATGGENSASDSWCAVTMALRPA